MFVMNRTPNTPRDSDVTDEETFKHRRHLLKAMGFVGSNALLAQSAQAEGLFDWLQKSQSKAPFVQTPLSFQAAPESPEPLTTEHKATHYNNFYEFGLSKSDPSENAQSFQVNPWQLTIDGDVHKPLTLSYDQLFPSQLEERIYRLRCVEAWSMVIPWIGFPLSYWLKQVQPKTSAKYLAFETLHDPDRMPGQRRGRLAGGIRYPYIEGLRLDEAMHPLTFIAVGVYGKTLPPQNGAPVRLIVPWKYGFKSIKSLVRLRFTETQPDTTWNLSAPDEYGFYANVNPKVNHPRWSQAFERRIVSGGLGNDQRILTQPFNGYGEQVASLYSGMDLSRYY